MEKMICCDCGSSMVEVERTVYDDYDWVCYECTCCGSIDYVEEGN